MDSNPNSFIFLGSIKLILPAHLALLKPIKPNQKQNIISRLQGRVSDSMERFVDKIYRPILRLALRGRHIVVTVFISLFLVSIGLIVGERIKWEFFPEVEAEIISTKVKMIEGVAFETTSEAAIKIEEAAKILDKNIVKNLLAADKKYVSHGFVVSPFKTGFSPITPTGDNLGEVATEIRSTKEVSQLDNLLQSGENHRVSACRIRGVFPKPIRGFWKCDRPRIVWREYGSIARGD